MNEELSDDVSPGTDRRTALKKAAIAAGVVAWTTPAVQAVTARAVHAQGVTGCTPTLTLGAVTQKTGPFCECAPDFKSCCSDNTVFIDPEGVGATCGATCPGTPTVEVTDIIGDGVKPGCKALGFIELICPGGKDQVTVVATVTCPDGVVFTDVTQVFTVVCLPCLKAGATGSTLLEEPSLDRVPQEETPPDGSGGETPDESDSGGSPPGDGSPPVGGTDTGTDTGGGGTDTGGGGTDTGSDSGGGTGSGGDTDTGGGTDTSTP